MHDSNVRKHIYPGNLISEFEKVADVEQYLQGFSWSPLFENGIIVYGFSNTLHSSIHNLPRVKQLEEGSLGSQLGVTPIYPLPIHSESALHCRVDQADVLHFSSQFEAKGVFNVPITQHWYQSPEPVYYERWEKVLGCTARGPMEAARVRVWIRPAKKPTQKTLQELASIIDRWLHLSIGAPPPVGGAKGIKRIQEHAFNGGKWTGIYCELDLQDSNVETFAALLAMLVTFSETVLPLENVIVG
jgi:hypothetical protein